MPNLFVIGAMKAGTTALFSILSQHPEIYTPSIKEPNHFCSDLWEASKHISVCSDMYLHESSVKGKHNALVMLDSHYRRLYEGVSGRHRYVVDSSPLYLRSLAAAKRIYEHNSRAKLICLVRDPIDRAISHYQMERNEARVAANFRDEIQFELGVIGKEIVLQHDILRSGLYYSGLSRFLCHFPLSNVLILDISELSNPERLFVKLNQFLGFEKNQFSKNIIKDNASHSARFSMLNFLLARSGLKALIRKTVPVSVIKYGKRIYYNDRRGSNGISSDIQNILVEFYKEDVKALSGLMKEGLPGWMGKYLVS